jgi:hypothetical protein
MVSTPTTEAWKENQQYQLIPHDDNFWQVRILEGDFIECVISYGKLKFDDKNHTMTFDFTLDYTPDNSVTSEDPQLQKVVGYILHSILVGAFDEH